MPSYLVQAAYTAEAMAALVKNPQNRLDVVRKMAESHGGKLIGDYDIVMIAEMPDNVSAAAIAMAAAAGGSVRAIKTTPLLTADEGQAALKKAAASGYTPVQK
jgi:uncharacterized protein with GYD domain